MSGDFGDSVFGGRRFDLGGGCRKRSIAAINWNDIWRRIHRIRSTSATNTKNQRRQGTRNPKGLTVYSVGGRAFATIGMERDGGLFTYEVLGPSSRALSTHDE
jgi:hypothetical protein